MKQTHVAVTKYKKNFVNGHAQLTVVYSSKTLD